MCLCVCERRRCDYVALQMQMLKMGYTRLLCFGSVWLESSVCVGVCVQGIIYLFLAYYRHGN